MIILWQLATSLHFFKLFCTERLVLQSMLSAISIWPLLATSIQDFSFGRNGILSVSMLGGIVCV